MTEMRIELSDAGWVPTSCTLPDAERPQRVEAFTALFAEAVRGMDRPAPGRLRLDLNPTPVTAARAAGLAASETGCCSFFTFTLTAVAGKLTLDIAVDTSRTLVLDALADQVNAARQKGQS